jgi:site-specific DNA recombinase
MGMIPLCVAIYARVSSEQQATSSTIDSQIAALEARLAQDGLALIPEGRFTDEGYSGATLVRPALDRLRDAVAAGNLDRLYVHSPDRLARRYAYQVLLIDEFHRAGVEIIFLNRPIGLSPEDDLLLQVQGMVAEYERAKILERSRRGKRHAARQGAVSVLSGAPYGYRYVGKRDGGVARYEILEDEAWIVRRIFAWIGRERVSIGETCRRLQQEGILTRSGKPAWDRSTVWGILRNPAYAGMAAFGKTRIGPMPARLRPVRGGSEQPRRAHGVYDVAPGEWISVPVPPLVDEALFEAAREQLAENRRRNRRHARGQRYLLQGLVVCRQCGYAYYGKAISLRSAKGKRRAYAYYRCCGSDAYRFGGERLCANPQVRTDRLDEAVWREVERVLQDPSWLAAEYERRLVQARDPTTGDLAGIEAQIAKLRRGMGRLIDGYAEGLIDKADFEPRVAGLRQRIKSWDEQAATLRDEAAQRAALSLIVGRLHDFARQVRDRIAAVDWSLQRDLIRLLVRRVEMDHGDINVVFRVAPSFDPGYGGSQDDSSLHHRGRGDQPRPFKSLHALCIRRVDDAHASRPPLVPLRGRRGGALPDRAGRSGAPRRAGCSAGGVRAADAPGQDADRLLQGRQPDRALSQDPI